MWSGPQVHRRVNPASSLFQSHRRMLGSGCCAQDGNVEVICHLEPILQPISALDGTWPHIPCCWLTCCTVTQTLHTQPPADTGFSRWGVVQLRAVSDVVGTHPEAKEHSVSRWLSRNMNVMKSHACNQHEESQVSAPHGVVSNTPLRVVHKSLKNGMLIVMGPARLLQSVGT